MHRESGPSNTSLLMGSFIVGSLMAAYVLDTWYVVPLTVFAVLFGRYVALRLSRRK